MNDRHRFKDEWLTRLLQDVPRLTSDILDAWRAEARPYLAQAVVDAGVLDVSDLTDRVRKAFRIEPVDPEAMETDEQAFALIPESLCKRYDLFPLRPSERFIQIAMPNPVDMNALEEVSWAAGREATPLYCLPAQMDRLMGERFRPEAVIYDLVKRFQVEEEVEVLGEGSQEEGLEAPDVIRAPVVRLVNALIADAVHRGASDIHVEHEEKTSLVRFRIDGHLKNIMYLPRYLGTGPLVARVKIMANMDVSERFRPQDGRAKLRIGQDEVGLRVSTLPTRIGEKVVIRILDERASRVPFEALGFRAPIRDRFEALIQRDQGILLVTGPTGSGKTTTLYSALNRVKAEDINIITIEDPVEYRLPGISQVQVEEKKGLTFAAVLRSVLRQDPDIVMVGEIRDRETAEIACQAALTGHLVFSTLHTNDTVSTVTRLVDMGVDAFKIGTAVIGITAQRLVRRLCATCSHPGDIDAVAPEVREFLRRRLDHPVVFEATGCAACSFSGYKGRIGLVELLEVTPKIRDAIGHGGTAEDLRRLALSTGALHTLEEDIVQHLQEGHTSVEEVLPFLDLPIPGQEDAPETAPKAAGSSGTTSRPEPAAVADSEPRGVAAPASDSQAGVPTVLLAVADGSIRGPLADLLLEAGMEVVEKRNGSEALQEAARRTPDLLIAGRNLPGVDGPSLITSVRTVLGLVDLPILALASDADAQEMEQMLDAGADDYIGVPIVPKAAGARIRGALGRRVAWLSPEEAMRPKIPVTEAGRMEAVRATGLLDSAPEERFDRITRKAQETFGVPIAYVALVEGERQWFKSKQGLEVDETPREVAFCAHAINEDQTLLIPDSRLDPRFSENPLVTGDPGVRFYAGVPLRSPEGHKVGTMCIVDRAPRNLSHEELGVLEGMAKEVEREIWPAA